MQLMTVKETAAYLKLSEVQTKRLMASNTIPHFKLGRLNRVDQAELDKWLISRARVKSR
ncbi:MAG: DNA-binding protein [Clostridia bacterium]|jgi:excisionase family DNA binding protein|nr:DNA-binding protein [Clostridia bacterium]